MQPLNTQNKIDFTSLNMPINLILVVHSDSDFQATRYVITQTKQLIIGRGDPNKNWQPDVDLRNYGGQTLGVSRLHAAFKQHHNNVYIIDLFSFNGTFINEMMLFPYQPHLVRHGDTIRIGQMKIQYRLAEQAHKVCV